jgi:hypothetical protein
MSTQKEDKNYSYKEETYTSSCQWTNENGEKHGSSLKTHKLNDNGNTTEERTEEEILPTGEKNVTQTIRHGEETKTNEYHLKAGE